MRQACEYRSALQAASRHSPASEDGLVQQACAAVSPQFSPGSMSNHLDTSLNENLAPMTILVRTYLKRNGPR